MALGHLVGQVIILELNPFGGGEVHNIEFPGSFRSGKYANTNESSTKNRTVIATWQPTALLEGLHPRVRLWNEPDYCLDEHIFIHVCVF